MMPTLPSVLRRVRPLWGLLTALLLLGSGRASAQINNDECTTAQSVQVSANCAMPVNGTVQGATQSLAPTAACGFNVTTANDAWYSFVATGASQLITLAPRFQAILDVRSGSCATSTSIFCAQVFAGNTNPSSVSGLTSGQTYFIRVYASGATPPAGISSTFALCVAPGASTATPPNDNCAAAIDIPVQSGGVCTTQVVGDNTGATASPGAPAVACANYQGGDIWFKVTVPASGSVTVQTVAPASGSPINDTGMAMYSGSCTALTELGCDDDGGSVGGYSLLTVSGRTPGEVLYVRVWEFGNNAFGPIAMCAVTFSPPANDNCAGAVSLPVNTACNAVVSGTLALASQSLPPSANCGNIATANDVWYSFVASGATQSLTITAGFQTVVDVRSGTCANSTSVYCASGFGNQPRILSGLTAGQTYFLRIYADGQQPQPAAAGFTLCLTGGPVAPANDECAQAIAVPVTAACTTPVSGTLSGASQSLAPTPNCGGGTTANDVWYSFVASGPTQTVTLTSTFAAVLDVRSGTCASSTSIFCSNTFAPQGLTVGGLTTGQTYFIRVYTGFQVANPTFTLCINPGPTPPANDECAGAINVPVNASCVNPTAGTYVAAGQSLPATANCGLATTTRDVWYTFTATGPTQIITVSGNLGAVIDVRSGTCASSTSVFCATTFNAQGLVVSGLTSGQAYYLRLYPNNNIQPTPQNGNFTLCIQPGPPPSANDECATAVPVAVVQSCATSTNGTVASATQSLPPTSACGNNVTTAADVWYSFVASAPTQLITLTSRFAAIMDVRSGTCASSTSRFCTAVFQNTATGTVVGGLTTGQTYYIRIYANGNTQPTPANATFTLCINPAPTAPANDECAQAQNIPVTATCASPLAGSVEGASQSLAPTAACGLNNVVAQDVWYTFTATGPTHQITMFSLFPAVLDVRAGTCTNSSSIFCTTGFQNNTTTSLVGGLTTGQTYFVRVYANGNQQPSSLNASFSLCITPGPTPPANDECATAIPLTIGSTCTPTNGSVAAASQSLPPSTTCGFGGNVANDVWYSFVATAASQSITLAPQFAAVLDVRSGTCANSTGIFCANVQGTAPSTQLLGGLTVGQTYYIRVYSATMVQPIGNAATFTLCLTPAPTAPANDDCAGALNVPVQFGNTCVSQTSASNAAATSSTGPAAPTCGNYQGGDIWFKVTVPASGTLTVQTLAAPGSPINDTGMSIYAGTCANLVQIGCDDDNGTGNFSLLNLTGRTPGEVLYVRVWEWGGNATGTMAVCATSPTTCPAPSAPVAGTITSSGASLSWQPGGTPTAGTTYTVEFGPQGFNPGTGTQLTGLTSASAQLTGLQPATAYCFYVRQDCPGTTGGSALVGPTCFTTATGTVTCPAPNTLAANNLTSSSADLSWQMSSTPNPGVSYAVSYGPPGFNPLTGTIVTVTALNAQLTGLQPNTNYCFYVQTLCSGTVGSSAYVGPQCFTTAAAPTCPAPSSLPATNVAAFSATINWQPAGTPTPNTQYDIEYGIQGFMPGTGTAVSGLNTPSFALNGLQANTSYCYYVRQSCLSGPGSSSFAGPFCFQTLTAPAVPVNDEPCGAVPVTVTLPNAPLQPVSSSNVGGTTSTQPGTAGSACSAATSPQDVWFEMTPTSGLVTLTLTGSAAGMVRVFTVADCSTGPFTLVACQSSGASNTGISTVGLSNLTAGQRYYIAVSGYADGDTPGTFTIAAANVVTSARPRIDSKALLVYPNPSSSGQLTLRLNGHPGPGQATLLNALGQEVRRAELAAGNGEQVLSTRGLASGVYTLRVVIGTDILTRKVVLE